jgi:hypothetical protein
VYGWLSDLRTGTEMERRLKSHWLISSRSVATVLGCMVTSVDRSTGATTHQALHCWTRIKAMRAKSVEG